MTKIEKANIPFFFCRFDK